LPISTLKTLTVLCKEAFIYLEIAIENVAFRPSVSNQLTWYERNREEKTASTVAKML